MTTVCDYTDVLTVVVVLACVLIERSRKKSFGGASFKSIFIISPTATMFDIKKVKDKNMIGREWGRSIRSLLG